MRRKGLMRDTLHITIEEQLLMFLHTVGHNQRNRVIAHNFLRSSETDCIGALDGTHIHASVPVSEVAEFRGRKAYSTQNVLVAVDFDLHFTYVLAGWEGSAHDALVLRDALERPNGLSVPEGKYYLVDAGYATRPGFIAPYRGVRYHLKEFGSQTPANHKELFNLRHSSARTTIERAFGSLKGHFKIFSSRPFFPFKTQAELVLAACILHNYIISGGEDIFIPSEEEWTPPRPPSERNMREQREEVNEWVAHREQIARDMWTNK
ncbi:putative nuclease HARBI1 [Dioscorea cayenensis subsp. rotundata]|uniref:Nuclease HARBI1 n=1 Tax=Dioscorea cayennensis subsp. rotundata TaxID=55577 RepID=A0AB40AU83_DIOCR|nr:putative nuclease HARBI1 [Dioscorea cayenensis subsp. rotundata]